MGAATGLSSSVITTVWEERKGKTCFVFFVFFFTAPPHIFVTASLKQNMILIKFG